MIEFPQNGYVLTRHDGKENGDGLEIIVKGRCPQGAVVEVNSIAAQCNDGTFQVPILISKTITEITVSSGSHKKTVTVLYDRHSFPRYRISLDDNIWFLSEIGQNPSRYPSLFEHWYPAFFKNLHDTVIFPPI